MQPLEVDPWPHGPTPDLKDRLAGRRLWVSGAAGFIGRRVCAVAEEAGAEVVVFPGDVREGLQDHVAATRPDLLLHLAAPVNVARDPDLAPFMDSVIVGGARAAVTAADALARTGQATRLVVVGTCEEYGAITAPFAEDAAPSAPVSPYAAAKLRATRETLASATTSAAELVVARPFLTYGPGQRSAQLVPSAIRAALRRERFEMTQGRQTRELNYVDDIARGLLRVVAARGTGRGTIVNIGCGQDLPVVEIVRRIFTLVGAPHTLIAAGSLPERAGEVRRFFADVERARAQYGHQALVSLDGGLRRTIEAQEPG